jgi:hypothetical protein
MVISWFHYPGSIFTILLAAYVAARIGILRSANIVLWFDAFSYAYRNDPHWDRGHLVSFTGHAPRLWGTPLFYAMFSSDQPRLRAQWLITTIAWALLAWAVWKCLRSIPVRALASAAILAFALLTPVSAWDFTILSESLSISLGVIVVACFLLWARSGSRVALVGMTAAGFYWTFVRPELRLFVVILLAVLLFYVWRRRDLRRWALGAVAVLVAGVAWCSAITPTMTASFGPKYTITHLSASGDYLMFKAFYIYGDPRVKQIYEQQLGMPQCPGMEIALRDEKGFFAALDAYKACPDLSKWGDEHGDDGLGFALAAPDLELKQVWYVAAAAFSGRDGYGLYGGSKPFFPSRLDRLMFHNSYKALAALFGALLLAAVAAFWVGAFRRRRLLVASALVLTVSGLVSWVAGVIILDSEPARYAIQENFAIRIALLLLAAAAADVFIERRAERKLAVTPVEPAPSESAPAPAAAPEVGPAAEVETESLTPPVPRQRRVPVVTASGGDGAA